MASVATRPPSLKQLYRHALACLGPQHWWPATTTFEMMVGAMLTQATAWPNVERAIARLKAAGLLSASALAAVNRSVLQRLIRPTGYFRQKAARLQTFSRWYVATYGGSPRRLFRTERATLRQQLLAVPGVGPETADSILLYAGRQPVFVVDAYTRRILRRHYLIAGDESYEALQRFCTDQVPADASLCNECHALLVEVGKRYCHRRDPDCGPCPLGIFPHTHEGSHHG